MTCQQIVGWHFTSSNRLSLVKLFIQNLQLFYNPTSIPVTVGSSLVLVLTESF